MGYIKRFLRQDRDYFANNQAYIRQQNGAILRVACIIYGVILAAYTAITAVSGVSRTLTNMYLAYDAVHIALCIAVLVRSPDKDGRGRFLAGCRIVFEISLLSFFLLEAVFPFPAEQSIYIPFPIMLLVVSFIYRPRQAFALMLGYLCTFVLFVCLFKSPAVRLNDIYIAAATLISASVGYVIIAVLRHETGGAIGRLRYLSMTDAMTGIYNKQTFESLCAAYMEDAAGSRGYALLFFDVDYFKSINDRFGHPFGDTVLIGIADAMRSSFYEKDYLCRFGGDEFAVFMADVRSEAHVNERVKAFRQKVAALGRSLGADGLSCSIGVAMKAEHAESYAELLSRADAALYVAKKNRPRDGVSPEPPARPDRVLIVDDNAINRQVLRKILSTDYEVIEAVNGEDALAILNRRYEEIAAVLLDIVMPVMDGYRLLRIMRSTEHLADIPVIVITGYGEDESELQALSIGADDYVMKPYRPAIIMHRLQNTIGRGGRPAAPLAAEDLPARD